MRYEVWLEGYMATGERSTAQKLVPLADRFGNLSQTWEADSFPAACEKALRTLGFEMTRRTNGVKGSLYDKKNNTYWACRFYDNEAEARKSFG